MSDLNKPDWKYAPPRAKAVACDGDGVWFWYASKNPTPTDVGFDSDCDLWVARDSGHDHVEKWRETLERRP